MTEQNSNRGVNASAQHVFIIGSKGIPAAYGGFETFVDKLTEYSQSENIQYHVACRGQEYKRFRYHGADCFTIRVRNNKPQMAIYYDLTALRYVVRYLKRHPEIEHPIVYILACRIGPMLGKYVREIHSLGGLVYVNPDGHEWKRDKWSTPVKCYWKISEMLSVKRADLLICDSRHIEKYIQKEYRRVHPNTTYIAYGSETLPSGMSDQDPKLLAWYEEYGLKAGEYYLIVGRFVPENHFETMIREFMASHTNKKLAIITTPNPELYSRIDERLHFTEDHRICFTESVYDQELLKKIRERAYAYLHGHSVGGTNPSLLEALGSTELNLLYNVGFNREVAEETALYWDLTKGSLASLIDRVEKTGQAERVKLGTDAKKRVEQLYNWPSITDQYERLFLQTSEDKSTDAAHAPAKKTSQENTSRKSAKKGNARKEGIRPEDRIQVIIAAHKQFRMPEDPIYLPVHVGAEGKTDADGQPLDLGYVKDNTGENISELNPSFCELTGLYWAWKNLDADYLGLVHYRRHFRNGTMRTKDPFESVLTGETLRRILKNHEIVVPYKQHYVIETLYSHYEHTHFADHLDQTRNIIREMCPEYLASYDRVMKQRSGCMFNMMIMRRDLLDQYCSWLFPILQELRVRCGDTELSAFQGRFYGRVSELIFNVWLDFMITTGQLDRKRIARLPLVYAEKINWFKKGKAFLAAKFMSRKYEQSF